MPGESAPAAAVIAGAPPLSRPRRSFWALRYGLVTTLAFATLLLLAWPAGMFTPRGRALLLVGASIALAATALLRILFRARPDAWTALSAASIAGQLVVTTLVIYASGSLESPFLFFYGPLAVSIGTNRGPRTGLAQCVLHALVPATLGWLEYRGVLTHMPLYADGTDPGFYRHGGFVVVVPLLVLAHMWAVSMATRLLSRRLQSSWSTARTREDERWETLGRVSRRLVEQLREPLGDAARQASRLQETADGAQAVRFARSIAREVQRLEDLLQAYGEIGAVPELRPQIIDLREVVLSVERLLRAEEERTVRFTLPRRPLPAAADAARLHEALLNLIRNARQWSGPDGNVRVTLRRQAADAEIEVADDGPGIPPEALPRIFDPFFSTRPRGTGIGLAVVRAIARAHGGEARAGHASRDGAVFTLTLPLVAEGR